MKFGVFFAYWTHEWKGDYLKYARKVRELGFDMLEISPGQLLNMSRQELLEFKAVTKDLGLTISSNLGPPKEKDVASRTRLYARQAYNFKPIS